MGTLHGKTITNPLTLIEPITTPRIPRGYHLAWMGDPPDTFGIYHPDGQLMWSSTKGWRKWRMHP